MGGREDEGLLEGFSPQPHWGQLHVDVPMLPVSPVATAAKACVGCRSWCLSVLSGTVGRTNCLERSYSQPNVFPFFP